MSILGHFSWITQHNGVESQETIEAIRKEFFKNNRYFTKDSDIVHIKLKRKSNIPDAIEVFLELSVTLHTFDRAKVHPRNAGIMVHLKFIDDLQLKVRLYNQYYPSIIMQKVFSHWAHHQGMSSLGQLL